MYGSWSPAASMATPRFGAAATTLSDGRVLVVGGQGTDGPVLSSTELYDPTTNTWSPGAPLPSPLEDAAAAPLPGDEVLVVGGTSGDGLPIAATEIYDGVTNTWTSGPVMPVGMAGPAASTLGDGRILASEGVTNEIYDPSTGSWTMVAPNERGIGDAAAPLGAGLVAVVGAGNGESEATPVEMYDASNNTWTYLPDTFSNMDWQPSPAFDDGAIASLPGGGLLALGGGGTTGASLYDPAIHDWLPAASFTSPLIQPSAATLPHGDVLVAGGISTDAKGAGSVTSAAMIYTPPASLAGAVGEEVESPAIDGQPYVGEKLTAFGVDGSEFSYQWERCQGMTCSPTGPPTPSTSEESVYTVTSADVGFSIQVIATDTGSGDTRLGMSRTSNPTDIITAATMGFNAGMGEDGDGIELNLTRDDVAPVGSVHYEITWPVTGREPLVVPIAGTATFLPGQSQAQITVPSVSHGVNVLPREFVVTLSDPIGGAITGPTQITVPICTTNEPCDISMIRNPLDPLALRNDPGSDPLRGAALFVDHQSLAAKAAANESNPADARLLERIAREPGVARFGAWNGAYPGRAVESYLDRAIVQEPGSVPMIATYRIVDGQCHHGDDTPADAAIYHDWISNFAEGIGDRPAVLFLEMDSIITTPCLSKAGLAIRLGELRDALAVLSNCPHLVVYLDAGAADALSAHRAAHLLEQAGIAYAQGFFLNSTHFDWTRKEIKYGEHISRLTHGKHFVINTAENGQGPLKPRHPARQGNEVLCNPPGRGLGPLPSTKTGYRNLDALAWIANPGVSGGTCRPGAPKTGVFWPAMAISLAHNADYTVR